MTKQSIRQEIKKVRQSYTKQQIDEASIEITHKLLTLEEFKASSIVFLYAAIAQEVQTRLIFEEAKKHHKKVAFPKVCTNTNTMEFYIVDTLEELIPIKYKSTVLYEPNGDEVKKVIPDTQTLMIAPGLAFDYNKNRIGYGGGFYDKYMNKYHPYVIGICFDFPIKNLLPREPLDCMLNMIISEKQIIF